jgi:kumamolisin
MRIASNYVALAFVAAVGCSSSKPISNAQPTGRINGATDLGSVAPDSTYDFIVGIESQNTSLLHKFLSEQTRTGDTLGPIDFADRFSVSAAEYGRVVTWLRSQGMQVTRTVQGRNSVSVHATAAAIERAFGAQLHDYSDADGKFTASVSGLTISPEVSGSVSGLAGGFDGALDWKSHLVKPSAYGVPSSTPTPKAVPGKGASGTYQAAELETLYNTSALSMPGLGQTIVILGAVIAPTQADMTQYFTTNKPYGLTTYPGHYSVDNLGGAPREPDGGEGGENTLDIDMVMAFAPYATVHHVITATSQAGFFLDGITHIVDTYTQPSNMAIAVTVSYGSCERGSAGEMPILNAILAQAKAAGQTWFFAAGDSGTDGCRNGPGNTVVSAGWPASSPYAVGVGGTDISAIAGATTPASGEIPWNDNDLTISFFGPAKFGGAGGGGVSESLDKPAFQTGVGPGKNDNSRDEPDVAALGGNPGVEIWMVDPSTGAETAEPTAGTSAATPMWAGIWALIAQAKSLTSINNGLEQIYKLGAAGKGFNDITYGNNGGPGDQATGGYPAMAGYDLATGWGTPNVPEIIANWP